EILPVAIHGKGGIKLIRRGPVSYGELIPNSELHMDEGKKSEIRRAAGLVMDRIKALWEAENCR
ncbi:MAG: hypothetical protein LIO46_06135, partial [Clostridiales bacterium]|nr:hypothetical protein [Clostridiales bacterium]